MPLYKTISFNSKTQIYVWKIAESYEQLKNELVLNKKSSLRLKSMKSEMHQCGFLSIRNLLREAGYSDTDLYYDTSGKPHLKDNKFISITHSHNFSAIIISDVAVGIDIELQRDKIIKIAPKFCHLEFEYLNAETADFIRKLTVIWGTKEAVFKIQNQEGISFKNHIYVYPFELNSKQNIAKLRFESVEKDFKIHFEEIENFSLVYVFED